MFSLEAWEMASYVVTVIGLPMAIVVFVMERRKQLQADHEEIYQRLSDEYREFLKLVLDNADLGLLCRRAPQVPLSDEQIERRQALFGILISLFERAFLLVYDTAMDAENRRLWLTWEDYMREWCARRDFRQALPELLAGEDPQFCEHIRRLANESVP